MTDNELLELMNAIIKVARPVSAEELKLSTLDKPMKETGLDSLDFLMVGIYLSDVYGVSEENMKAMKLEETSTVRDMINYVIAHKTKEPASLAEALELIK